MLRKQLGKVGSKDEQKESNWSKKWGMTDAPI